MKRYKQNFEQIRKALDALDAGFSLRQVAKVSGVPASTLQRAAAGGLRYLFEDDLDNARSFRDRRERPALFGKKP